MQGLPSCRACLQGLQALSCLQGPTIPIAIRKVGAALLIKSSLFQNRKYLLFNPSAPLFIIEL
jgi:hypothetical protein